MRRNCRKVSREKMICLKNISIVQIKYFFIENILGHYSDGIKLKNIFFNKKIKLYVYEKNLKHSRTIGFFPPSVQTP